MDGILLITNASAGSNEEQAVADAVDVLDKDHDVEVAATKEPEELAAVLDRCDGRPVVVAGGDGTLHAARAAAPLIVDRHTSPVDLILSQDGTVIVNNVHLGVGAQASRKAEKWKPRLGKAGDAVGALAASLRPDFLHVDVFVDEEGVTLEEVVHDHLAQVAIGNGKYVGGGTALIPGAEVGDGQLVVIVSKAVGRWGRVAYAARLHGGTHHMMKEVTPGHGRSVTVKGEPFHTVADGEIAGPFTERCWELLGGGVQMSLPAPSEAADAAQPTKGPPEGPV